jgi:hypothetical protein
MVRATLGAMAMALPEIERAAAAASSANFFMNVLLRTAHGAMSRGTATEARVR